jgi:CRISPR-associated protein Cmr1
MARTIPDLFREAPSAPHSEPQPVKLDFKITTALYGGGVEAGMADRITPIRASEVRGMLRFWWRASVGSKFDRVKDLREAESAVWGATDHVSPITIEILNANAGTPIPSIHREGNRPIYEEPRYALFPAQSRDKERNLDSRPIHKSGTFQLKFRCPNELVKDLDAALRYWINFGGIGSRTRRGLGSLYCANSCSDGKSWYNPADFPSHEQAASWPRLKGARIAIGSQPMTHQVAWESAVNLMRDFRQDRNGRMGRSKWTEPDAIRRITGQTAQVHSSPVTTANEFPRSQFGMPIIFHFRQDGHRAGDPDPQTLVPARDGKALDRMASPVILKPMAVSATQSVPICLILNTPKASQLMLEENGSTVTAGRRDVLTELVNRAKREWRGEIYTL